jgi:hypothetical protein
VTSPAAASIVLLVHYYPPINSSGAKRMEALSKYAARWGRRVTVVATRKSSADGVFTESVPDGVDLIEIDALGRVRPSERPVEVDVDARSTSPGLAGRIKTFVQDLLGQVPDPRLPFGLAFASPWLDERVKTALRSADVVVGTTPPWPPLLAAVICRGRFGLPAVLDYRDPLSNCHEMRGGPIAKALELILDRWLLKRADAVVAISEPMSDYYRTLYPTVHTVMNGYDPERLDQAKAAAASREPVESRPLVIRYLGIITPGRIPNALLAALQRLHDEGVDLATRFRFEYYGEWQGMVEHLDARHPDLKPIFSFHPFVPYAQALNLIVTADHVLFCENQVPPLPGRESSASGILTTKLFEYVASGRPVLADIAPDTTAGSFIVRSSPAHFVSTDPDAHYRHLNSAEFRGAAAVEPTPFVQTLSREAQSRAYVDLLDRIVSGPKPPRPS